MFNRRITALVLAVLVALTLLTGTLTGGLVTVPAAQAATDPVPEDDPFYVVPADVASHHNGEILDVRRITARMGELPLLVDAWQLKYRTEDHRGRPTATVTTLLVPKNAWRRGGVRPLVSYQTAEDGVTGRCAPSYALRSGISAHLTGSYSETPLIALALLQGWAVAVPDYEGPHSMFLIADVEAKGVLDGIRAAQSFRPAGLAKSPVGIWGYSGGAFATANAAQLQPSYAPDVRLTAIALGGLVGDVRSTIDAFSGSIAGGAIPMGIVGFRRAYPELDIDQYLNASGKKKVDAAEDECLFDAVTHDTFLRMNQLGAAPNVLDAPALTRMLRENSPLHRSGIPGAPVYAYHTRGDEFAPIAPAWATLRNYCAGGAVVQLDQKVLGEHLSEIVLGAPGALNFLRSRFAGHTPRNTCARIPG